MKNALDLVADAEFVRRKKGMISFLQGINYDDLQSRAEKVFFDPQPHAKLIQLKSELDGLERKIKDHKKEDPVSFPTYDREVEQFTQRFDEIIRNFRQSTRKGYECIITEFSRGFARAKRQKSSLLQKTIASLRALSKEYSFFRDLGGFEENKDIQDYYEFHLELHKLDADAADLIGRYVQSQTTEDIEEAREKAEEIRQGYNAAKKQRSSFLSLHPAFKYENKAFAELEKELKTADFKELFKTKAEIAKGIAKAKGNISIINDMDEDDLSLEDLAQLAAMQNIAGNQRFTQYRNILFLNRAVYQHDELSETVKRKASALMKKEADILDKLYGVLKEKSKEIPQRFEEIANFLLGVDYYSGIESINKKLEQCRLRYQALGYNADEIDKLIERNKHRAQEIKAVEKEYGKIWGIKRDVESLKQEVEQKGASLERIERLAKLNSRPRSTERKIRYGGLRNDYNAKVQNLIELITSAVISLIEAVDRQYDEAEKNPSYNLDSVIQQYEQLHKMTDVSSRVEKSHSLKDYREKQDREKRLKKRLADLAREKAELEEQNQLTELQSAQYAERIEGLTGQLEASEAEKTAYQERAEAEKARLEAKTSGYEAVISELRNQGINKEELKPEDQEADGYNLKELLKTFGEPGNPDLKIFGDTLLGTYHNCRWISRISHIADEVKSMQDCGVTLDSPADIKYLTGVSECIKASMHNGHLRDTTKKFSGHRKTVYDAVKLIDGFLHQSA